MLRVYIRHTQCLMHVYHTAGLQHCFHCALSVLNIDSYVIYYSPYRSVLLASQPVIHIATIIGSDDLNRLYTHKNGALSSPVSTGNIHYMTVSHIDV